MTSWWKIEGLKVPPKTYCMQCGKLMRGNRTFWAMLFFDPFNDIKCACCYHARCIPNVVLGQFAVAQWNKNIHDHTEPKIEQCNCMACQQLRADKAKMEQDWKNAGYDPDIPF